MPLNRKVIYSHFSPINWWLPSQNFSTKINHPDISQMMLKYKRKKVSFLLSNNFVTLTNETGSQQNWILRLWNVNGDKAGVYYLSNNGAPKDAKKWLTQYEVEHSLRWLLLTVIYPNVHYCIIYYIRTISYLFDTL